MRLASLGVGTAPGRHVLNGCLLTLHVKNRLAVGNRYPVLLANRLQIPEDGTIAVDGDDVGRVIGTPVGDTAKLWIDGIRKPADKPRRILKAPDSVNELLGLIGKTRKHLGRPLGDIPPDGGVGEGKGEDDRLRRKWRDVTPYASCSKAGRASRHSNVQDGATASLVLRAVERRLQKRRERRDLRRVGDQVVSDEDNAPPGLLDCSDSLV